MDTEDSTTAVTVPKPPIVSGSKALGIVPTTYEDAYRIASAVVKAGMAPRGIDTAEKATVIILHGLEVGMAPMAALQSITLINGKPSLYGDGALGVVRCSPVFEKISERISRDGELVAICTVKRRGEPPLTRRFSEKDAKLAGLWGKKNRDGSPTPWASYPERMLQMRARGFALRDGFADVLKGLGIGEEQADIPVIDATPVVAPPPPDMEAEPTPLERAIADAAAKKATDENYYAGEQWDKKVVWDKDGERPMTEAD